LSWQVGFVFWAENDVGPAKWHSLTGFVVSRKTMGVPESQVEELKQRLDAGENLFLLDVRDEQPVGQLQSEGARLLLNTAKQPTGRRAQTRPGLADSEFLTSRDCIARRRAVLSPAEVVEMKTNSSKNQAGRILGIVVAGVVLLLCCTSLWAQNLGWEGETGVFVTPLAYTAGVEGKIAEPVVGFHFLDAGPVIGQFYEASITVGLGKRFEVGYTSDMHVEGGNAELSPLWHNGFNIFNGKVNLLPENFKKQSWVPAVSVGFIARTQVHNVGGAIMNQNTSNGDIYLVASKTITQTKPIPIVISGGVRGTNAELWGMAGNAPNWQARGFGAVAFVFKGPKASTIILASEVAQEPLRIPSTCRMPTFRRR